MLSQVLRKFLQLVAIVRMLEFGFGDNERGDWPLAAQFGHLFENAISARSTFRAEKANVSKFGGLRADIGAHWRGKIPRPDRRAEDDKVIVSRIFDRGADPIDLFRQRVIRRSQIPVKTSPVLDVLNLLKIGITRLGNGLGNLLCVSRPRIVDNENAHRQPHMTA